MDKSKFSITKSHVECYKIRHQSGMYWTDITIDAKGETGRIQIASDYGSWQYYWGAAGPSFKQFLMGLNIEYVAEKFGVGRRFDFDSTINEYKRHVIDLRKQDVLSSERARNLWNEIESFNDYDHGEKDSFTNEMWRKTDLLNLYDHCPPINLRIEPLFQRFWETLWPLFIRELQAELVEQ